MILQKEGGEEITLLLSMMNPLFDREVPVPHGKGFFPAMVCRKFLYLSES
jgi:hypothetical protein